MLANLNFKHLIGLIIGSTSIFIMILGISVQSINSTFKDVTLNWHQIDTNSLQRAELLNSIVSDLGYGSMIHNFKDAVLLRDHEFVHRAENVLGNAQAIIKLFAALDLGTADKEALRQLQVVLARYAQGLPKVHSTAVNKGSVEELDRIVKVDDRPAVEALETLFRSVFAKAEDNPTLRKWRLLTQLRRQLGYGGMIHLYKNTILRGTLDKKASVMAEKFRQIETTLGALGRDANTEEQIALDAIRSMVGKYKIRYAKLRALSKQGQSLHELTMAAKIDDRVILNGFQTLEKRFISDRIMQKRQFGALLFQANDDMHFMQKVIFAFLIFSSAIWILIVNHIIAQPIIKLTKSFNHLAAGNVDVEIPGLGLKNELGDMARAADTFRRSLIERRDARELQAQITCISKDIFENTEDAVLLLKGEHFIDCNPAGVRMLNAQCSRKRAGN